MKLTLQLHLLPTPDQHTALRDTMRLYNEAATYAAARGFADGVFGQVSLHHLAYHEIRKRFGLSSQLAVRAIAKAVECFQRDKTVCPTFKPDGALCYDQRVLSFQGRNWAFAQLRSFVEYKAQLAGVPVVLVDPKHTSQGCNRCGHVARASRQHQARFSCKHCGYTTNADFNAANNIRDRARVKAPLVAGRCRQLRLPLAMPATSSR